MIARRSNIALKSAAALVALLAASPALANPVDGTVAAGAATITTPAQGTLTIDQHTKIVIIDWKSFNIGKGETTTFNQPGSDAMAVNRIGGNDPAKILGSLAANGKVVLIDGNGILFGKGAKVNVGSLLATTADASNADILSGKANFSSTDPNSTARIVNKGEITASSGMVGLVAPSVANNGVIRAKMGQVTLGSARVFTIDFNGDGLIAFPVDPSLIAGALDENGKPVKALVANNGKIEGQTVLLSAKTAAQLVTNVISVKGDIVARAVSEQGGHIILDGGTGGIALAGARLDASGDKGGGSITIGSDTAASVTVDATSTLDVSAKTVGDGGSIYVNSANTQFHGTATARGGATSGNGGKVETSGHALNVDNAVIDTSAASGATGQWSLDPTDLTINSTFASTLQTALATTSVTLKTNASGNPTFTGVASGGVATNGNGDILVNSAITWTSSNTLTLDAFHSVIFSAPVTVAGGGKVVLKSDDGGSGGKIDFGLLMNGSAGKLSFTGTEGSGQALTINTVAQTLLYTAAEVQAINTSATTLGKSYAVARDIDLGSIASFVPLGDGTTNFTGSFQGLNNTVSNLTELNPSSSVYAGLFGLTQGATLKDLNLSNVSITVDGSGAVPRYVAPLVANANETAAPGNVGTTLSNVTTSGVISVNHAHSPAIVAGLVGLLEVGGTGSNLASSVTVTETGSDVSQSVIVGGLIGTNDATITQSAATGAVSGATFVGGFVGQNSGTISQSYATGAVTLTNTLATAGLTDTTNGSVTLYAGGFAAFNGRSSNAGNIVTFPGIIQQSYATGAVVVNAGSNRPGTLNITSAAGGFTGGNTKRFTGDSVDSGTLREVYATGFVGGNPTLAGGLVGQNTPNAGVTATAGIVPNSYWDTQTTGQAKVSGDAGASTTGGMTTAQLQGTLPSGFNTVVASVWATGAGLYPYFGWANPNGVQAVSGIAYKDFGSVPDGSSALGAVPVSLTVGGVAQGSVNTGANGYYYFQLPSGSIANSAAITTATTANTTTGAITASASVTASATVSGLNITVGNGISGTVYSDYGVTALGSANVKEMMLTGGAVIGSATSNATTGAYAVATPGSSGAVMLFLDNSNGKLANTIVNYTSGSLTGVNLYAGYLSFFNTSAVSASAALSQLSSFVTPTGFAAPGLFSANDFLFVGTNPLGSLAITSTSTTGFIVDGTNGFSFSGSGSLAIKTTATDIYLPNAVSLANGTLTLDSFHDINVGANITISGSGKAAITTNDGGTGGDYTFFQGKSLEFTGTANSGQVLTINGSAYTLLYTMADVQNINSALTTNFALAKPLTGTTLTPIAPQVTFSDASAFSGTFEGLGNTISGTAISDGTSSFVGLFSTLAGSGIIRDFGLVGGSVKTTSGDFSIAVGGLVGDSHGTILKSWSTATVTGGFYAGGLVARAAGGSISSSYATGAVTGTGDVGGLVGQMSNTTITNSYATGNVSGSSTAGGLIGAASSGSVTNVFSTGTSSGGGLDGSGGASFSNAYWNTTVSGKSTSPDGTGVSTTALQAGPTGLNATPWVVASGVNPALNWQGAMPLPVPPVTISGNVYSDYGLTALGGVTVREIAAAGGTGATAIASATSVAATGAYSLTAPSSNGNYLLFLDGGSVFATTVFEYKGASVTGVNLYGGYLNFFNTSAVSASATLGELAGFTRPTAFGAGDFLFNGTTASANLAISTAATTGFTTFGLDGVASVGSSNTLALNLGQALVQATSALTAGNLLLQGTAGYVIGGAVGTVAANTRSVHILADSVPLTIGKVEGVSGITATDVQITQSAVSVTIAAGSKIQVGAHQDVIISAPAFVNNEGSDAITTGTGGAWAIYTASPAGDTFGNLDSGNTAIWNTAFNPSGTPPASNRYIFANSPTLTFTSTDATKTYGADGASALASAYTVSGFQGVTGVFAADTAATVFSGAPSLASSGTASTATVAGGPYAITAAQGTLAALNGYTFAFASTGKLTVTPAPLTVALTGSVAKTYDGTTTAALSTGDYSLGGLLNGDAVTVGTTAGTYDNANASSGKIVTVSSLALSGTAASNYSIAPSVSGAVGLVTPALLTATLTGSVTKTYDGTTAATLGSGNYGLTGVIAADATRVALNNPAAGTYADANAGQGKVVTVTGLALSGTAAANYSIASSSISGAVGVIIAKALTWSVADAAASYGTLATPGAATLTGVLTQDTGKVTGTLGIFDSGNNAVTLGATTNAGSYNETVTGLSGTAAGNYVLAATGNRIGTLVINPVVLAANAVTYSVANATSTYGTLATLGAATLTGVLAQDAANVSGTVGAFDSSNAAVTLTATSNAGVYTEKVTALTGSAAGNYVLSAVGSTNGVLTINPKTLTAALTGSVSKIYDGLTSVSLAANNFVLSGALAGDTVALASLPTTGSFASKNVGTGLTVTSGSGLTLTGASAGNYTVAATAGGAIGQIAQKALTVALSSMTVSKTYDTTLAASLTAANFTLGGVASGDAVSVATTAGSFDTKNAGTGKTVYVAGITLAGGDAGNYYLPNAAASAAVGMITAATVTATLSGNVEKIFDNTAAATVATSNIGLAGVLGSDVVTINTGTSASYNNVNAATNKTVTVSGLSLSGSDAGNYVLASNSVAAAVGRIDPTALTVIAALLTGSVNKTYDGTNVATLTTGNYLIQGLAPGATDVRLNDPTTGTYDNANAGSGKTITVTGLAIAGGNDAINYILPVTTISGAIGTITPATLTASFNGTVNKIYDGTTTASVTSANVSLSGLIGSDAVALATLSGIYDSKDAGTGKTVTVNGLTLTGTAARNYVLAFNSLSGAAGVITPKTLTTTLTGSVQKTYDGTATAAVTTTNLSVSGVISGDAASLTAPASLTFDTKDVGTGKIVTVNGLGLTGAQAGDYVLAANVSAAIGIIVPKLVTVSLAGTPTKTYDGTTAAALTSSNFTLNGAVSGDNVGIAAVTGSYSTASAGTGKTLSANGLTLSGTAAGDYILTGNSVSGAVGVISPKTLTALLTGSVAKTYDGTTAAALVAGNYSLSGIVGSDVVTLNNPAIGIYADKNAGTGKVVSVSGLMLAGTAAGNYVLAATSLAGAVGLISLAPLTVQVNNASRQETQPNPDLSITLQGLVGGDTASVLTGVTLSTAAGITSPVGTYAVTSAGGSATNYVVTQRLDGTLTVTPRPANADVPGLNNALPASNSNYNGSLPSFGTTAPAPGSSAGVTGAGGSLICDVSNNDANTQTCRTGGSQAANPAPHKAAGLVRKVRAAMLKISRRAA